MSYDIQSIDEIIDFLGGPSVIGQWLGITQEAVSMWKVRQSIPPGWHLKLVVAINRRGKTVDPELFGISDDDVPFLSVAAVA